MKFNYAPYNDTFSEDENYYKFLFKPGYEVQSRELNSMQTMLQNQIAAIGNHLFKNGAKISGCSNSFIQYDYVRLNEVYDDEPIVLKPYNNKNIKLVGVVSGVEATIIDATEQSIDDAPCLIIIYTKTGIDNEQTTFVPGEDIEFRDENDVLVYTATVRCPSCPENQTTDTVDPLGKSLIFNIAEGIFYYSGYFVNVDAHHIIIEKYLTKNEDGLIVSDRTYKVGLEVTESIVTALEDDTLYDPHLGYPNRAAEGADRYKIDLTLGVRQYESDDADTSFILLAKVRQNHTVEYKKDDTEYAEIMKELARRTYEASGNFANVPWRAHFLNEKKLNKADTKGWTESGKDENFVAILTPGTGYVKGYRVNNSSDAIVVGRKARDTKKLRGAAVSFQECTNITVKVTTNFSWINHTTNSTLTDQVFNIFDANNSSIGSFKAYDIYYEGPQLYKIYLYDLNMINNQTLASAKSIKLSDNSFIGTIEGILNLHNANNTSLIFPLGYKAVKTIRDNDNNNNGNTDVNVRKRFSGVLDSNGSITFTSASNEVFISPGAAQPICWVGSNPTGAIVELLSSMYAYSSTSLRLNLGSAHASKNVTLITSVGRTAQMEKTKTLTRHSYTTNSKPGGGINDILTLPHADGYRLDSVKLVSTVDSELNEDITNEYVFNDGQTDNFYTPATISRTTTRIFNNDDRLIVTYYYFEHSGSAPFFSVDSYAQLVNDPELDLEYGDIPTYTDRNGSVYRLAECIDFRSIKMGTLDPNALVPQFNSTAVFDIEYYLARNDLLMVDTESRFYFKEGVSSESPVLPSPDENAMPLYEVYLEPYVYSMDDIRVKYIDNKTFNMKDISRLFKRVENIEQSIALSMLEQQTLNMSIKDQNGFDRYKNGFLVDNFKGYQGSDLLNADYKAAIDRTKGQLRPQFKQNNIKLAFDKAASSNIVTFGNMAITKFVNDLFIQNPYATQSLSINPYLVFRRTGNMALSPNIDTWADDTHLPTIVTNIDAGVDALRAVANAADLLGTDYSSWIDFNTSIIDTQTETNVTTSGLTTTTQTINSTTTRTDSSRTATNVSIGTETQAYTIDDIVKDVSIIPYIRSAVVQFYASNLKPNTRVYAFFDGVAVSQHCKPTTQISGTSNSAIFGANPLITDANGSITGEFRIPGNTFFTGEKKFILSNDPTFSGNPDVETTRCEATYFAGGVAQTKQSSTLNVITPTFNRVTTTENRSTTAVSRDVSVTTVTQPAPAVVAAPAAAPVQQTGVFLSGRWWSSVAEWARSDPVAQGFKVDESCFISQIGVYFATVDSESDIIWFEIREMINGYPATENIARREVRASELASFATANASKEYVVKFGVPVYVDSSKSYAFVVGGFSPETRLYISTLGHALLNQPSVILEQPPLGYTMFRSLNGETWNAQQFDTMKINIYRCVFDMSGTKFKFKADNVNAFSVACDPTPLEMEAGSRMVRVYAKNHGLREGDSAVIDFSPSKRYEIEITAGIPQIGQIIRSSTAEGTVSDIILNTAGKYEIVLTRLTGSFEIEQTFTCDPRQYEFRDEHLMADIGVSSQAITQNTASGKIKKINNMTSAQTINNINISVFAKAHNVYRVDSIDSFVIQISENAPTTGRFGSESIVIHGNNIKYDMFNVAGQSLSYNANTSWSVSPYKFDGGFASIYNVIPLADNYMTEPGVLLSSRNQSQAGANTFELEVNATLVSPYISPVFNTDSFSVTTVSNRLDLIDVNKFNMAPNANNRYVNETKNFGSELYKHITTKVLLQNPAVDMRLLVDVYAGSTSEFDIYVKLLNAPNEDESSVDWLKFDKYNKVRMNNSDTVAYDLTLSEHCTGWDANSQYISYRVKLVGRGSNSSQPVIFQNLRAIAIT